MAFQPPPAQGRSSSAHAQVLCQSPCGDGPSPAWLEPSRAPGRAGTPGEPGGSLFPPAKESSHHHGQARQRCLQGEEGTDSLAQLRAGTACPCSSSWNTCLCGIPACVIGPFPRGDSQPLPAFMPSLPRASGNKWKVFSS